LEIRVVIIESVPVKNHHSILAVERPLINANNFVEPLCKVLGGALFTSTELNAPIAKIGGFIYYSK